MKSRLKEIMKEQGRSQKWLSEKVGVSMTTISSLKKEKSLPSLPLALRIAKTLGKTIEDIWHEE
ncbi:helix-turn-helix transcriptional regulator [Bacillus sp. OK048]|uniref:helix-turn-helix transcriptional regulator n=1 Tax=Bacillus sp. OK048 TaxID=1882761 RepID=UPI0008886A28|nr:helix-turn-helix transcriptional regulator [Bacillus sp. OK048]SDM16855.1 putative transcriptional regulator [Bacillus sp. OK048]